LALTTLHSHECPIATDTIEASQEFLACGRSGEARRARSVPTGSAIAARLGQSQGPIRRDENPDDQFGLGASGNGVGAGGLAGVPCCMSGMFRIPGMSCMPPGCPGWGCIMAMFRQHGHMPPADWPG
jgi:hypothetical protein